MYHWCRKTGLYRSDWLGSFVHLGRLDSRFHHRRAIKRCRYENVGIYYQTPKILTQEVEMQEPFLPVEDEQAIWLGPQVWLAPPATVLLSQFSSSTPGSQSCSPSHLET